MVSRLPLRQIRVRRLNVPTGRRRVIVRSFSILDAMVLVAATAVGLKIISFWIRPEDLSGQFRSFQNGTSLLRFIADTLGFSWAVDVPLLRLRRPRPPLRFLGRQPGFVACYAVVLRVRVACLARRLRVDSTWPEGSLGNPHQLAGRPDVRAIHRAGGGAGVDRLAPRPRLEVRGRLPRSPGSRNWCAVARDACRDAGGNLLQCHFIVMPVERKKARIQTTAPDPFPCSGPRRYDLVPVRHVGPLLPRRQPGVPGDSGERVAVAVAVGDGPAGGRVALTKRGPDDRREAYRRRRRLGGRPGDLDRSRTATTTLERARTPEISGPRPAI